MLTMRSTSGNQDISVVDDYVDEMDEDSLVEIADNDPNTAHQSHHAAYDDEDDPVDGEYGGMSIETYDNIVEYKKNGTYPTSTNTRQDRSANSHWRSKCARFALATDNETLLYYNQTNPTFINEPKYVVKKGEVRRVVERIHELIGHLGQKRTQIVVLKRLYWRSVRQDTKQYILNCNFCMRKKLEGKKILKAPVDVTSDNFDVRVIVRSNADIEANGGERLSFELVGYDERDVQMASLSNSRMTSYTFKETAPDLRGRFARVPPEGQPQFRRQPYIKRRRYSQYSSGFLLPYTERNMSKEEEPRFVEIFQGDRMATLNDQEDYDQLEELSEQLDAAAEAESKPFPEDSRMLPSTSMYNPEAEVKKPITNQYHAPANIRPVQRVERRPMTDNMRKRRIGKGMTTSLATASRFNIALRGSERIDIHDTIHHHNLTSYESSVMNLPVRPESMLLPPIMLMPSVDPEVIQLQKELLTRQLKLQKIMTKRYMQGQIDNSVRIGRYEEVDPNDERVLLEEQDVDDEQDDDMDDHLNVEDDDDRDIRQFRQVQQ